MIDSTLGSRFRRGAPLALAALLSLAACHGALPAGSPPASPTAEGSNGPVPSATAGLSPSPGVTEPVAPTSTATLEPSSSPTVTGRLGQIDHPTEPTDVVLRMLVNGGFTAPAFQLTAASVFTLYGDDSVVYRPSQGASFLTDAGFGLAAFQRATLTPDQVDTLLGFALDQGGLRDARESYTDIPVADAMNTTFTIDAGGVDKQVFVVALGFQATGPDAADRSKFSALGDQLDSFDQQVNAGDAEAAGPYQPTWYRTFLTDASGQTGQAIDWPWTDVAVSDFTAPADGAARVAHLTPEQVSLVAVVPSGGIDDLLIRAPDRTVYALSLRPLLPDEQPIVPVPTD